MIPPKLQKSKKNRSSGIDKCIWHKIICFVLLAVYCDEIVPIAPNDSMSYVHNAEERKINDTGFFSITSYLKIRLVHIKRTGYKNEKL